MLAHYNLLLGKKRIGIYNIIFTIQILTLLITLVYRIFILHDPSIESWIISLYFAYGVAGMLSFIAVISKIGDLSLAGSFEVIKQVFRFGLITQLANILHIGNKRISFYFVKMFTGLPAVGVYGAGTQLTEGVRLLGYHTESAGPKSRGLVVMLHGWEGSADSTYILSVAPKLIAAGYSVFRLNFRDHGDSHHLNRELFHSCRFATGFAVCV